MLKKGKKQGGITLIALVITIIVLLILAAVTINALSGDNGILKRASQAKKGTNQSNVEEVTKLSINGLITDNLGDVSTITPQVLANRINKDYNRTDVTAEDSEFPTNMVFAKEKLAVPVDIKLTVGTAEKSEDNSGIYAGDIDESKIAPPELFNYEPISTGSNNKIASTGDMTSLPLKEARITGIKPEYANAEGYNPEEKKRNLADTNYEIRFEGITDTLIVPYQVQIDGEMYKVTEVNISISYQAYRDEPYSIPAPNIENIIFPNTVKKINVSGISGWNSHRLERKTKTIKLPNKITELPEGIYESANHMTTFEIPKSVTKIEERAFSECKNLTSIDLPKGLTSIGERAFLRCTGLTDISIPDGVTNIGPGAFDGCTKLASIDLPKGLTSIGREAFWGCTGLTDISIPDGVTNIGPGAFNGCTKLASVTYKGVTYHSRNELLSALSNNNVTVESGFAGKFEGTALKDYDNNNKNPE